MKRNLKRTLAFSICAIILLVGLVLLLIHPARLSPKETLAAELVGVTNAVAFITITNRSDVMLIVHVESQSHSHTGGWHTFVSTQYPSLAGKQTRLAKIGLGEGTSDQRVIILFSTSPGRIRQAAFEYCIKLKTKWLIPLFWPKTQEAVVLSVQPEL